MLGPPKWDRIEALSREFVLGEGEEGLNVGCGADIRPGWTNLDRAPLEGVDVVLNVETAPLPFRDGTFDKVLAKDFLEHVPHRAPVCEGEFFIHFINELIRVTRPGGEWLVLSPCSPYAFQAIGHTRIITLSTFRPWVQDGVLSGEMRMFTKGRMEVLEETPIREVRYPYLGRARYLKLHFRVLENGGCRE